MKKDVRRGQIWWVELDPALGAEIKKKRPALIISNNLNNKYADTVTLCPVSDKGKKVYPFEVFIPVQKGLRKDSKIKCQQIRTVDKQRLIKLLGVITEDNLQEVQEAMLIHLGMDEKISLSAT